MPENEGELSRNLGFVGATAIGLGTMIGGGIFVLSSIAAAQAGPASVVSFALAGLISLLAALSHAELATDMPREGGGYQYVNRALGPLWGSIVGWGMWIGLAFATAFYVVGFARYMTCFSSDLPITIAAAPLSLLLVGVNYYGVAEAGWVQNTIVGILLALLAVFVGAGLGRVDPTMLTPFAPNGAAAVVATTGTVYVALIGFSLIATAAGEIENPEPNVPLSMITAAVLPTILYVLVMVISAGVLSVDAIAGSQMPVADVAEVFLGAIGGLAMVLGAALATISSANASILSASRVSFAMSEDRVLTDWFRETHERFDTPYQALAATAVAILALLFADVPLNLLAEMASSAFLATYGLVHVAVIRFRRDGDLAYDPDFEIPDALYPHVPAIGVLATLGVMSQMEPVVVLGGTGLLLFGALWYAGYVYDGDVERRGLRIE